MKINKGLSYEEEYVHILDHQVRRRRTKDVTSVKILWRNHNSEEVTWEAEEDMKRRYPRLFPIQLCINLSVIEILEMSANDMKPIVYVER